MAIVQFPQYRLHDAARTAANNAIMALLAGAHLASHTLQLTEGSELLLPEIFPHVSHIKRFNLKTTSARSLLRDAEVHLGTMAVPYMLAIHEDFVMTCLRMRRPSINPRSVRAFEMHNLLKAEIPSVVWGPHLEAFHAARLLRNCMIHSGGVVTPDVVADLQQFVKAPGEAEWRRHTNRSPLKLDVNDRITFAHGELVATLSATHRIAVAINEALQVTMSRAEWADLIVQDIRTSAPHLAARSTARTRKCVGYARHLYGVLGLTEPEIENGTCQGV